MNRKTGQKGRGATEKQAEVLSRYGLFFSGMTSELASTMITFISSCGWRPDLEQKRKLWEMRERELKQTPKAGADRRRLMKEKAVVFMPRARVAKMVEYGACLHDGCPVDRCEIDPRKS